jgi:parallel beta-helix repeat protein
LGNGADDVIVRDVGAGGTNSGMVFFGGSNIDVTDFRYRRTSPSAFGLGVELIGVTGATLTNIDVENVGWGIFLRNSSDVDIQNVTSTNNTLGIYLVSSTDVMIDMVQASYTLPVTGGPVSAINIDDSGTFGPVPNNIDISNVTFTASAPNSAIQAINIADATNVTVTGLTATNVSSGVFLTNTTGATLSNLMVTNGVGAAVHLANSTDVSVSDLTATMVETGLLATSSQNVDAMNVAVENFTLAGIRVLFSSDINVDGFTLANGNGDGIFIFGDDLSFQNGSISDVAGGGILLNNTGAMGAAFSNIDISGISTNGTFRSGAAVTIQSNSVASFNQVDIDGENSGGTPVTLYGFDFHDLVGQTKTVSGTGNTVVNVPNVCARMGGSTINSTLQVNGNPEPGTSC